jgi:hypothetical protein
VEKIITVEPQKQPLPSNARKQQENNWVMKSVSRQRLGEHISAYRSVLCNAATSSKIQTVFSVGSMQSAYERSEYKSSKLFQSSCESVAGRT